MKVEVVLTPSEQAEVLERLLQLYLYEFSDVDGREIGEDGRYRYGYLEAYWQERGRYPFLIRADGKLAGFALIAERGLFLHPGEPGHLIVEFFVLRRYRRRHIGDQAARLLFERFAGPWEVPVFEANALGSPFWASVIPRYSPADYRQSRTEWDGQPVVIWLFETHL